MLAGEIGKPHGLAGEVYVVPISDDPHRFDHGSVLERADGDKLTVESSRPHNNRLLVKFEGVDSRPDAEALRGALFIGPDDLRKLEEGEYWQHEVIGCAVELADGSAVGTVADLLQHSAQDLLAVDTPNGQKLIPFVEAFIVDVDVSAHRIVVDPPPGLLE